VKEIEAANAEFYAAFEALDLGRMAAVWADGPYAEGLTCVHAGWPMLKGRSEVLRSWALIMANTPYIQFVLTDVTIYADQERAVVTCGENILTADDETELGLLAAGTVVATNVFVRTPDGWKLWLHHGSPVLNQIGEEQE
jgi:ketosteroid isomerase-like protein